MTASSLGLSAEVLVCPDLARNIDGGMAGRFGKGE